jgi:hypothetical protein
MKKYLLIHCFLYLHVLSYAQLPSDFVIPAKVTVNVQQPSITISWPANADASTYTIKRKIVTDESYAFPFTQIGTISNASAAATMFTDTDVVPGKMYEYEISASFISTLPTAKSTYVCAGINIEPVHTRGSIILLCDSTIVADIADNLKRLHEDLIGDGWKVIRIDVARSNNPQDVKAVKNKIHDTYTVHPDLKQVLIIGHVPVPYSGAINPDGHGNHYGAWPSDGYYGDMQNTWTDNINVPAVPSTRPENINISGDGKFDQNDFTSVQLAVGRVDFANLPAFNTTEISLLKRYLNKNRLFRFGEIAVSKRALIEDNFPLFSEKFSQAPWKSFAATAGYDNVFTGQYDTDLLSSGGYLWSYGNGAGSYTSASGIGLTSDFATRSYKTVFTQLFGSYFGDWDSQDNYMRAALASAGNTLACVWGGRPHWFLHHMSAGSPIGYSALLTINNTGTYTNTGSSKKMVHIALMGDPSLRSSYIKPVAKVSPAVNAAAVDITWITSPEPGLAGYYIYRGNSIDATFTLLNESPVSTNNFTDNTPAVGNNVYMIRAVKADTIITAGAYTNNSTFYNLSQGVFDSVFFNNVILPVKLISFEGSTNNSCSVILKWETGNESGSKQFTIEYSSNGSQFQPAGVIGTNHLDNNKIKKYSFQHSPGPGKAFYRIKMIDTDGAYAYSKVLVLPVNCSRNAVLVYPNPVKDFLNINITARPGTSANAACLFDAGGRLVYKKMLTNGSNTIFTGKMPPGIYNLKVVYTNGEVEYFKVKK